MAPKVIRVAGPAKPQQQQQQGTFGSIVSAVTSAENRSVVTAVGMFTVGVAFLHSSWSELIIPA